MWATWVLGSLHKGMVCLDLEGNVQLVNAAAESLLAVGASDVIEQNFFSAFEPRRSDGEVASLADLQQLAEGQGCTLYLPQFGGKDGLLGCAIPLTDEHRQVRGFALEIQQSHVDEVVKPTGSAPEGGDDAFITTRRVFERRLENLVDDALTSSRTHALLYIDIDQFRVVNDTSGHTAGDKLVQIVAASLENELLVGDEIRRLGGDEFGVLLSNVDTFEAKAVANRLVKAAKKIKFHWGGISHNASISIGVVLINDRSVDQGTVMSQADIAVYSAKDSGRGRLHLYDEQDQQLHQLHTDMDWVHRIHHALSKNEFRLVSEKIIALQHGDADEDIHYQEILVRMHSNGELLRPGQFMPAAERFGLMPQIDRWVIKNFFDFLQSRPDISKQNALFSINISGQSLCEESFLEFVYRYLQRPGINPQLICFEITETVAITNFKVVCDFIARVHELGGRFALDDFGTGMSSFGYLQELPVDFVKIDGLFVHDMDTNDIHEAMVRSINDISRVLGKRTIAEFVERPAIIERLRKLGVDFAQGHYLGMPTPLDQLQLGWPGLLGDG